MQKKLILGSLAGLGFFIVALLVTAPASIIENLLITNAPSIQVQGTSGGFWSGQFQKISHRNIALNKITWDLSLFSLFTGKIGTDLSVDDPLFNGQLTLEKSLSSVTISNVNAQQSVTLLASYWLPIKFLSPVGKLVWSDVLVSLSDTVAESTFTEAAGSIEWQNASLNINGETISLGTVVLQLSTDNGDLLLTVSDNNSRLNIRGTLRFSMDRKYHIQLSINDDLPTNIKNAVQMMARPDGNGRLTFSIPGRF